jgi:Zn-dependent metalloprotease
MVKPPGNVRLYRTRTSLLGTHKWYRQYHRGHPVVDGWYAIHRNNNGTVTIWDGRRPTRGLGALNVAVGPAVAERQVPRADTAQPGSSPQLMVLPAGGALPEARLVWAVVTVTTRGVVASYVDASTGEILRRTPLSRQLESTRQEAERPAARRVIGRGRVFDPNPVMALQNQAIRDRQDRNTKALRRAYTVVDLPRLREGSLAGRWVRIMNPDRARSATNRYFYSRANNRFEQVVAYHAIDAAQAYLVELGFRDANHHSQKVFTNDFPEDNAYYDPSRDAIHTGTGGVDDAEDVEVLWHEYGHALQDDQVPAFGRSLQAGSIGEGFGDYLAVTMSQPTAADTVRTPIACVADWDAVAYDPTAPHCLRRVDTNRRFDDRTFEVHDDGMIWSRALWDINRKLVPANPTRSRDRANRIIVEAHFWMNPVTTMRAAARVTVATARQLYGAEAARVVRSAFADRGIFGG